MLVHDDVAARVEVETCLGGEGALGAHADGEHDEVGGQLLGAVVELDARVGDGAQRRTEPHGHAVGAQVLGDDLGHLGVERAQQLGQHLDDRHVETRVDEVLGELEADEAAAGDDGAPGIPRRSDDGVHVGEVAQHEAALDAGDGDAHGARARAEDERVIGQGGLLPRAQVAHRHRAGVPVDGERLGAHAHVEG